MYTIALADYVTQVRMVHRSIIKGQLGSESGTLDGFEPRSEPEGNPPPLEENSLHLEEEDVDVVRVVRVGAGSSELVGQGRSLDSLEDIVPPLRTGLGQAETLVLVERELRSELGDSPWML